MHCNALLIQIRDSVIQHKQTVYIPFSPYNAYDKLLIPIPLHRLYNMQTGLNNNDNTNI